jgi:hypothetical protein
MRSWAKVEPGVRHLEETLGVPAVVLRLLRVDGSDGVRGGRVTYHSESLQPPGDLASCDVVDADLPLRLPWARASGVREPLGWACGPRRYAGGWLSSAWSCRCLAVSCRKG